MAAAVGRKTRPPSVPPSSPARSPGRNRLCFPANGKRGAKIRPFAGVDGTDDRPLGQTIVAEIREREVRWVVRPPVIPSEVEGSRGSYLKGFAPGSLGREGIRGSG